MDELEGLVQQLIDNNVPEEEIGKFIQTHQSTTPATKLPGQFISQDRPIRQAISNVYRPMLEMGGLVGGEVVGGAGGGVAGTVVAPGPGTAAGVVAGEVAGGSLGFASGANIADRLDEFIGLRKKMGLKESSIKALSDIERGAQYTVFGKAVGPALTIGGRGVAWMAEKTGVAGVFRKIKEFFPSFSDKQILKKAENLLKEIRGEDALAKKTGAQSERLLSEMEIKTAPTFGQKTGSVRATAHEQAATAKNNELKAILKGRDAQINQEGLEYIEKQFPSRKAAGDILKPIEEHKAKLSTDAWRAEEAVKEQAAKLSTGKRTQQVGEEIKSVLTGNEKTTKEAINKVYAQIPEGVEVSANPIKKTLQTVIGDFRKKGGSADTMPTAINKQIVKHLKATKGKTVTFDKLRDWRSQVGEEIRDQYSSSSPNLKLVRRLKMLESGVDDAMDQMLKSGNKDVAEIYRIASTEFKKYVQTFREKTVGKVLAKGKREAPLSEIPSKFFEQNKMDAADDLIRAVGVKKASALVDDFIGLDLLSSAGTSLEGGGGKTAMNWLSKNKDMLNKYGLYEKYKNIISAKNISTAKIAALREYETSVAGKMLGTDPGKLIPKIFSGAGKTQSAKVMGELLEMPGIKGNDTAINGLKNSFKDFILAKIENSGTDILGNPLRSISKIKEVLLTYAPAMKVLYRDNPKQIKALFDYHKLLTILSRNKNVTYAGGSTTVEKMSAQRETINTIGRNIGQLVAIQRGKGFFFGAIKNLWSAITGAPGKISQERIEALMVEAIHNPKVAETIMNATKNLSGPALKAVRKEFKHHLIAMGLYGATKKDNK